MTCTATTTVNVKEQGTAVITLTFTDEDGDTVVPTSLQWQLSDKIGTVINSNTFANNDFTAGDDIVLSGADLAFQSTSDDGERYFAIKGVYDSDAGNDLPLHGELKFNICNLVNFS